MTDLDRRIAKLEDDDDAHARCERCQGTLPHVEDVYLAVLSLVRGESPAPPAGICGCVDWQKHLEDTFQRVKSEIEARSVNVN